MCFFLTNFSITTSAVASENLHIYYIRMQWYSSTSNFAHDVLNLSGTVTQCSLCSMLKNRLKGAIFSPTQNWEANAACPAVCTAKSMQLRSTCNASLHMQAALQEREWPESCILLPLVIRCQVFADLQNNRYNADEDSCHCCLKCHLWVCVDCSVKTVIQCCITERRDWPMPSKRIWQRRSSEILDLKGLFLFLKESLSDCSTSLSR